MIEKRRNKSSLKVDIIKAFGADFDLEIRDSLFFVSENMRAIVYPVGHHIAIKDLYVREDMRKNDIMFIYNDTDVKRITSINASRDNNLLLVAEKREKSTCISVYNLSKLNFNSLTIFKPKRKVVSTIYSEFPYASFSIDGNYIASIGLVHHTEGSQSSTMLQGVIWDVQIFQPFKDDNYKPRCIFDLSPSVTKITMENKILCTSGNQHLAFWYIYENSVKEFKGGVKNLNTMNNNFLDHDWIAGKIPTVVTITDKNDIFILEGFYDKKDSKGRKKEEEDDSSIRIEKFIIRQHIVNCFNNFYLNACIVRSFSKGLVVGSQQGNLLFLEKLSQGELNYRPIRYTSRDKPSKVIGVAFNNIEEFMVVGFNSNEICTINATNIIENLSNESFELKFDLVCDGFHQGPITSMDLALQRPIIVTSSQADKTIRVWNYLTGHCEYCKIILTEKDNDEKEMDFLSVAIHPNGYYLAVSDREMIRFFHLCYRELRFYNNDILNNENPKSNCYLLKFSYGGHLLAAVSNKALYIIRSYTRETLKIFDIPHSGIIKSVFFHEQDYYCYTVGNDGLIVEYNLFDFKMEKISTKYINYTGAAMWNFSEKLVIMGCGHSASKYAVSEVTLHQSDHQQKDTFITNVNERVYSMCQVRSKKYEILSIATGSENGYLNLYPYPLSDNSTCTPWEGIKSHRNQITNIAYSRDTNLIFTTGEDGNLFIYCIYELPDGENIAFDDNKLTNLNQLTSILDEGLGDNVLYPIESIFEFEEQILTLKNSIADDKKQKAKLIGDYQGKLKELENKMNRQREGEIRGLDDKLKEMKISKDATIDHYEEKIKQIVNEHNRIMIEKEQNFNMRMDQMSNTVHDLTSQIHYLKNQHEIEMKRKDDEYEKKFRDLESELRKKFDEFKSNNDKLVDELQTRQKVEEMKFIHLDQEHEQEITYKIEAYEKLLAEEKKNRNENQTEINSLKDQKLKLEQEKSEKENENKKLTEELERLMVSNSNLKVIIEKKDKDNEDLKKKLKKSEELLQEKTVLAGFSSKLKNELYRKNTEILSGYNRQQYDISELKTNSKNIEKELEESMRLLEHYEKELTKQKILIDELKNKCEEERKYAKTKEGDFDSLLQKIYETFQSNDKNKIIGGIRKIYTMYLTDDKIKKIDSNKLNVNMRDELEKQIDFLQKSLVNNIEMKSKREIIQNGEIFRRTEQNSLLIDELNKNRKNYTDLEREYKRLKSDYSAMMKKMDNYVRTQEKDNTTLPSIKKSQEFTPTIHKQDETYQMNSTGQMVSSKPQPHPQGKLHKGTVLAKKKEERDSYKLGDIMKTIEDKNNLIIQQKLEIQRLANELIRSNANNTLNYAAQVTSSLNNNNFSSTTKFNVLDNENII